MSNESNARGSVAEDAVNGHIDAGAINAENTRRWAADMAAQMVSLVAGPYMYHHKMSDAHLKVAEAFDRCRELTIQNIRTHFAMLTAAASSAGCDCPGGAKPDPLSHAPNCPARAVLASAAAGTKPAEGGRETPSEKAGGCGATCCAGSGGEADDEPDVQEAYEAWLHSRRQHHSYALSPWIATLEAFRAGFHSRATTPPAKPEIASDVPVASQSPEETLRVKAPVGGSSGTGVAGYPEAVATLTVDYFRGHSGMVNTSFDYHGKLPEGTYSLGVIEPVGGSWNTTGSAQPTGSEPAAEKVDDVAAPLLAETRKLLADAYGYTTAAADLLPERIRKFLGDTAPQEDRGHG